MASTSRIGNSIFFVGLILLTLGAVVYSASDGNAGFIAALIGGIALLLMAIGAWLWNKPDPRQEATISRQSPKVKLLAVIPGAALTFLPIDNLDRTSRFLGLALLAVAFVGGLELLLDRTFPSAKGNWDRLPALAKVGISTVVIVAAFFAFVSAAMLIANHL